MVINDDDVAVLLMVVVTGAVKDVPVADAAGVELLVERTAVVAIVDVFVEGAVVLRRGVVLVDDDRFIVVVSGPDVIDVA